MPETIPAPQTNIVAWIRSDALARLFVWGVWAAMIAAALVSVIQYGRNIPLAEDWLLVGPLTGKESSFLRWLWEQNNEHRIPFPKLILMGLLAITGGDFRAGMVFNVIALGAIAAGFIRSAQALRGGKASYADAFFPILLLHLGNWENLVWGWQVTQVLPTILTLAVLLLFVQFRDLTHPKAAILSCACVLLLPLCGANGLAFTPPTAAWLSICAFLAWRSKPLQKRQRQMCLLLWGSSALALLLVALYFVGYVRPSWVPPNPGIRPSLVTAGQFAGLSLGPTARYYVPQAMAIALSMYAASAILLCLSVWRVDSSERLRTLGLLFFFGNTLAFALAMGWGRAGSIALDGNWPVRYVLMGAPALCAIYLIWELYAPRFLKPISRWGLFLGFCLLLPANTRQGFVWRAWYDNGMTALEADIAAGEEPIILAERYHTFLIHWWEPPRIAQAIEALRDTGRGPFSQLPSEPSQGASTEARPAAATEDAPSSPEQN